MTPFLSRPWQDWERVLKSTHIPTVILLPVTVTAIDQQNVLGQPDSVKTISLSSNHADFDLNPGLIKIGKQFGFIEFYPFYSFPDYYDSRYMQTPGPERL